MTDVVHLELPLFVDTEFTARRVAGREIDRVLRIASSEASSSIEEISFSILEELRALRGNVAVSFQLQTASGSIAKSDI